MKSNNTPSYLRTFFSEFGKAKLAAVVLTVPIAAVIGLGFLLYNPEFKLWKGIVGTATLFILLNMLMAIVTIYDNKLPQSNIKTSWNSYLGYELIMILISAIPIAYVFCNQP